MDNRVIARERVVGGQGDGCGNVSTRTELEPVANAPTPTELVQLFRRTTGPLQTSGYTDLANDVWHMMDRLTEEAEDE